MHVYLLPPALALLLPTLLAAPISGPAPISLTANQLVAIAPKSVSCLGATAPYASECQTAAQAAPPIQTSFQTYNITTRGAAAALIATMAFESGEFEYAFHHFPSPVPGQGTRNMQSPDYNLKYAKSLSALASVLPTAEAQGPDAVLALLVKYTNFDFGSAAWFLTTQCEPDVVSGLAAGTVAAYEGYVAGCVRGSPSDKRTAYFTKGMAVLGGNTGN